MRRMRVIVLLLAATTALTGCSDDVLDELGLSEEDRRELEELQDLAQDFGEAAEAAANGEEGGDGPPADPDWNPPGVPPPPGEPTDTTDYSDNTAACPAGFTCGHAAYDGDDGEAAREHYEDLFGRPPDTETERPSRDENGEPYDATSSTWDDGDVKVEVYTDHNGTDVHVRSDTATPE